MVKKDEDKIMDKFRNKYRIPSTRLQNWNYNWAAMYFITICTKKRKHYFGKIENGNMVLSQIGVIANILWYEIKNHSGNVELGEFVVMPNHVHGILVITKNDNDNDNNNNVETGHALSQQSHVQTVQTGHALSLQSQQSQQPTIGQQRFQNIGKNSISSIIGSYKSAVTKHARRLGYHFEWQTRFHDHIIRNNTEFERISNYIINNPINWNEDKFYEE